MKKIGVSGTFIRDEIIPLHGKPVGAVGGLYHPLACLSLLAGEASTILPFARLGKDFESAVRTALGSFQNIAFSHVIGDDKPNTCVRLEYFTPNDRDEITSERMAPLDVQECAGAADCDAIIVNMISGIDITLAALKAMHQFKTNLLYLDFHSLGYALDENGKRYGQPVPNWRCWLEHCDIVQMNENEALYLMQLLQPNPASFEAFIVQIMEMTHMRGMHITLGPEGSISGFRDGGKVTIKEIAFPPLEKTSVDIIGCGDVFGAGFVWHFLNTGDFFRATRYANTVASRNSLFAGSITKRKFEEFIKPYAALEN